MITEIELDLINAEEKGFVDYSDDLDMQKRERDLRKSHDAAQEVILSEIELKATSGQEILDIETMRADYEEAKATAKAERPPFWALYKDVDEGTQQPTPIKSESEFIQETATKILDNPRYAEIFKNDDQLLKATRGNRYAEHVINRTREFENLEIQRKGYAKSLIAQGFSAQEAFDYSKKAADTDWNNLEAFEPTRLEEAQMLAADGKLLQAAVHPFTDPWVVVPTIALLPLAASTAAASAGLPFWPMIGNTFSRIGAAALGTEYMTNLIVETALPKALDEVPDSLWAKGGTILAVAVGSGAVTGTIVKNILKESGPEVTRAAVWRHAEARYEKMVGQGRVDRVTKVAVKDLLEQVTAESIEAGKTSGKAVNATLQQAADSKGYTNLLGERVLKESTQNLADSEKVLEATLVERKVAIEKIAANAASEATIRATSDIDSGIETMHRAKRVELESELQDANEMVRAHEKLRNANLKRLEEVKGANISSETVTTMGEIPWTTALPALKTQNKSAAEILNYFKQSLPIDPVKRSKLEVLLNVQVEEGLLDGADDMLTAEDIVALLGALK